MSRPWRLRVSRARKAGYFKNRDEAMSLRVRIQGWGAIFKRAMSKRWHLSPQDRPKNVADRIERKANEKNRSFWYGRQYMMMNGGYNRKFAARIRLFAKVHNNKFVNARHNNRG